MVTWAIGHLVALAQPHEIRPEWKHWRRGLLPMLPRDWPLVVYEKTQPQFEVVRKILNSPRNAYAAFDSNSLSSSRAIAATFAKSCRVTETWKPCAA